MRPAFRLAVQVHLAWWAAFAAALIIGVGVWSSFRIAIAAGLVAIPLFVAAEILTRPDRPS